MSDLRWIRSLGGPMICMEEVLVSSWGGTKGLSVPSTTATSDYERASKAFGYVERLPLKTGIALVFGEGPLDTSIWRCMHGQTYIVQVVSSEEGFRPAYSLAEFVQNKSKVEDTLRITVGSASILLFDSVEAGALSGEKLKFELETGLHQIDTYIYSDDECSMILFRFNHLK